MMLPSHAHIQCVLNGTRITQWAGDDPPYGLETEEAVSVVISSDGSHFPMSNSNIGGSLKLYLAPHSKDVKWFLEREEKRLSDIIKRVPNEEFNGTLQDVVSGISVSLNYGYIIKIPAFPIAGQSFEVVLGFAKITTQYETNAWRNFGEYNSNDSEFTSVNDRAPGFRGETI